MVLMHCHWQGACEPEQERGEWPSWHASNRVQKKRSSSLCLTSRANGEQTTKITHHPPTQLSQPTSSGMHRTATQTAKQNMKDPSTLLPGPNGRAGGPKQAAQEGGQHHTPTTQKQTPNSPTDRPTRVPQRPPLATKRGEFAACAKLTSLVAESRVEKEQLANAIGGDENDGCPQKKATHLPQQRASGKRINPRRTQVTLLASPPLLLPRETDKTPSRKRMETDRPEKTPRNRTERNDDNAKRLHEKEHRASLPTTPAPQSGGQPSLHPTPTLSMPATREFSPSVMPSMREAMFWNDFARPRVCMCSILMCWFVALFGKTPD